MELNETLARQAAGCGICGEWHGRILRTESREELVRMYLDGILFCLRNDWPSVGFIRERFGDLCEENGIFIDRELALEDARRVVALGSCTGRAGYGGYSAGEVYITHDGRLTVEASGNAFVTVDVFGRAEVTLIASGNAKICANRYGGRIETRATGAGAMIRVRERNRCQL